MSDSNNRKKIGILSMQKVINYGSFLQAYGLRKLIKSINNDSVEFIDIIPGRILEINKINRAEKIKSIFVAIKNGELFEKIRNRIFMQKLRKQFQNDFFPLLNLNLENNKKDFSSVVIGSDEVFHCTQNASWGFSTQLLGDVKNSKNVFSYAASFGATTYYDIKNTDVFNEVKKNISKLNAISVRDNNSKLIIEKILGKSPELHLDPVLVADFEEEINLSKDVCFDEKFLIVYSYSGRIKDKKEIGSIKKFAEKNGLKIYTIFCQYEWADRTLIPETPFQLLKIFRMAEYIVSDTFHGTIFSIISHKKFCALVRESNKEKMTSLLERFGLEEHTVFNSDDLEDKISMNIDYEHIDEIRNFERNRSLVYLRKNLK